MRHDIQENRANPGRFVVLPVLFYFVAARKRLPMFEGNRLLPEGP